MKLSMLSGILSESGDRPGMRDENEVFHKLRQIGYEYIDIPFDFITSPTYILGGDDWEKKVDKLADTAAKLGIAVPQCHMPWVQGGFFPHDPRRNFCADYPEYFTECMRRSYVAAAKLGVKYATVHPMGFYEDTDSTEIQLRRNREYYDELVNLGIRLGVGTAFENMRPPAPDWKRSTRYSQNYGDLIELVDSYNDPMVGICWDTGHANQADTDQPTAIRAIGGRLKNLHINDNFRGSRDEHLLPFMGDIDWPGLLEALVDVNYQGVLNYETGKVVKWAPEALQMEMMKSVYQNGCQLVAMYEEIEARKKGCLE